MGRKSYLKQKIANEKSGNNFENMKYKKFIHNLTWANAINYRLPSALNGFKISELTIKSKHIALPTKKKYVIWEQPWGKCFLFFLFFVILGDSIELDMKIFKLRNQK